MIKYTKGFKEVNLYGFNKFVEKWNKYYCLECKLYFKKPYEVYNRLMIVVEMMLGMMVMIHIVQNVNLLILNILLM